ncbi:Transferase domain-containing protein [Cephalotus follicularis]|uniref:Transferase domain-containing protein n=1 Tax=Cephalotus follicularis TaxID=3775 RepID=A0A1Q3ATD9_CEPFO|nr:Transferase domain-containing protein [Cephalotus follicularis]
MVSLKEENLVYGIKISSIGPGRISGSDLIHEPNNTDLAMKLHYLKCVYFFSGEAVQELTIMHIRKTMFLWLNDEYITCGRFRKSESGRPYLKCNDCGIRFVEANCDKTVEEWLLMEDHSLHNQLVYHQPIGPELIFSPPVYIQVTRFKCGGISLGLSWAHILGDGFSFSDWINRWGLLIGGLKPNALPKFINSEEGSKIPAPIIGKELLSLKRVDPVDDLWVTPNNCKMETFSFHVSPTQMSNLKSKVSGDKHKFRSFESLCAIIWKCIAIVREGFEPKLVTICKKDPYTKGGVLSNSQIISAVRADFPVMDANLDQLVTLLVNQAIDERNVIEATVKTDNGLSDFILYGSNLTFVDLEETDLYGLKIYGKKPDFVYFTIQGVGDEGTVLVLPGKNDPGKDVEVETGRFVTLILPQDVMLKLKFELKNEFSIA